MDKHQNQPPSSHNLWTKPVTRRGFLSAAALLALSACGVEAAPSSPDTSTPTPPADRKKQPPAQGDHDDSTDQMTPEKIVERAKAGAELVHKTIESSLALAADVLGEDTYDSGNEDGYRRIFNKEYSVDDDGEPRPASPTPFVDVTYIPDTEGEGGQLKVWLAKDIGVPSDAVADEIALEFQLGSDNLITQYDTMTPDILRQIVTELVPGDGTITLTQMKGSASAGYITAGIDTPNTQNQTGVLFDVVSKDNVYKMAVADGDIPESIGYPYTPEDPTYAAAVKDVEAATEHVRKMLT